MFVARIGVLAPCVLAGILVSGCSKDEPERAAGTDAAASATTAVAPASVSAPEPAASVAAPLPPSADCPKGSAGPGSFDKPCEAKGAARMMEVQWTGKTDDKGPQFRITNKSPKVILYGKVTAYFYDKAKKQLEVKDGNGKTHASKGCGGNIFGGVMKVGEKAVLTFSCLKKEHIPEGTASIEAEIPVVGFADASEKKSELYWRNDDLAPDERKKGGVK